MQRLSTTTVKLNDNEQIAHKFFNERLNEGHNIPVSVGITMVEMKDHGIELSLDFWNWLSQ